jgi:hypothetical protein
MALDEAIAADLRWEWKDNAIDSLNLHKFGWTSRSGRELESWAPDRSIYRHLYLGICHPEENITQDTVRAFVNSIKKNGFYAVEVRDEYILLTRTSVAFRSTLLPDKAANVMKDLSRIMLLALEFSPNGLKENPPEFGYYTEAWNLIEEMAKKQEVK